MKAAVVVITIGCIAIGILAFEMKYLIQCIEKLTANQKKLVQRIRKLERASDVNRKAIQVVSDNAEEDIEKSDSERRKDYMNLNQRIGRIENWFNAAAIRRRKELGLKEKGENK